MLYVLRPRQHSIGHMGDGWLLLNIIRTSHTTYRTVSFPMIFKDP